MSSIDILVAYVDEQFYDMDHTNLSAEERDRWFHRILRTVVRRVEDMRDQEAGYC